MIFFRKHIVSAPLAILLALLLLNVSANVIERNVNKHYEGWQKEYNEIESLIELITEIGLEMTDLIPENNNEDEQSIKGKILIKFIIVKGEHFLHEVFKSTSYNPLLSTFYHLFESYILIPPPEN